MCNKISPQTPLKIKTTRYLIFWKNREDDYGGVAIFCIGLPQVERTISASKMREI